MARGNLDYDQVRDFCRLGAGTKYQMSNGIYTPGNVPKWGVDGTLEDSGKAASGIGTGGGAEVSGFYFGAPTPPALGDFTWVNQGAATVTDRVRGLYVSVPASGANFRILKKFAPTPPYTIRACALTNLFASGSQGAVIGWRNGATGQIQIYGLTNDRLAVANWNSPTSWNSTLVNPVHNIIGLHYLEISDDATNRKCGVSADGVNFEAVYSMSRTTFITPDEVFFAVYNESTTYRCGATLFGWDQS